MDRDLADSLRLQYPNAKLLVTDVLKVPLDAFRGHRVVGNLPYNISTPLLVRLLNEPRIIDMHFMLQHEVGLRLVARPGQKDWSRLSLMVQYGSRVDALLPVAAESFDPMPQVESMFVRIQPIEPPFVANDVETYANVVRAAFSQRRKTLANSLRTFEIRWHELNLDSTMRADHASVADYVNIANSIAAR